MAGPLNRYWTEATANPDCNNGYSAGGGLLYEPRSHAPPWIQISSGAGPPTVELCHKSSRNGAGAPLLLECFHCTVSCAGRYTGEADRSGVWEARCSVRVPRCECISVPLKVVFDRGSMRALHSSAIRDVREDRDYSGQLVLPPDSDAHTALTSCAKGTTWICLVNG